MNEIKTWFFVVCAVIILGGGTVAYQYYYGDFNGSVEIEKTFSETLKGQIITSYPEIRDLRNDSRITYITCGGLSQYECEKMADKLEKVLTKLCLDRNGIISVEVNSQGNIVRTIGDTSCLR